jgi:hypothetical protein
MEVGNGRRGEAIGRWRKVRVKGLRVEHASIPRFRHCILRLRRAGSAKFGEKGLGVANNGAGIA